VDEMECIICERKFENNILAETDEFTIALAIEPSVNGHIQIFSKEHSAIIEQIPDETLGKMMSAANKVSMLLFEVLKVHGTNIMINNGVPAGQKVAHFSIDILPRRTDDNLKLDWTLKQATPEALESIHRIIEEGMSKPEEEAMFIEERKDSMQKMSKTASRIERHENEENTQTEEENERHEPKEKKTNYYHQMLERIP
jgi:diadenosine tetraphosphate (Ap4A) HIT family hydrolase